jgi:hypothetical protein
MRRSALLLLLAVGLAAFGLGVASGSSLTVTTKLLSAYRTCVLSGIADTSTAVADTYATQLTPSANQGTKKDMRASSQSLSVERAFIRFDLSSCSPLIASTASIKVATLRLYVSTIPAQTRTYEVKEVTTPCPEGLSSCWGESTLTWNNQPGVAASATATTTVCTAGSCNNKYYSVAVTPDVAAFVAGTAVNRGWRISDSVEGSTLLYETAFRTKDQNSAATAPELVIVYAP